MTKRVSKERLFFDKPRVTPHAYTTRGPSGWPETFPRKKLDAELAAFLGRAPLAAVVDMFILQRSLSEKPTTWETVQGFLGRLLEIPHHEVPTEVALAMWGQVELELQRRNR
jgi:hypothetical protein